MSKERGKEVKELQERAGVVPEKALETAAEKLGGWFGVVPERRGENDQFVVDALRREETCCLLANYAPKTRRVKALIEQCSGICIVNVDLNLESRETGRRLKTHEEKIIVGIKVDVEEFGKRYGNYGAVMTHVKGGEKPQENRTALEAVVDRRTRGER